MFKKGFSLIEVMVVISIVSLLLSIILTNMQDSRDQANNTATIQNYLMGRSQLLANLAPDNDYSNACDANNFQPYEDASVSLGASNASCVSNVDGWAAEIQLPSGVGYYCLNLDGDARVYANSSNLSPGDFNCDGA